MSQPKMKWEKRGPFNAWDAMDESGRMQLCIIERSTASNKAYDIEITWTWPRAWLQLSGSRGPLILVNEPTSCADPVDAMLRCEQRIRDVLLAEFGDLLR